MTARHLAFGLLGVLSLIGCGGRFNLGERTEPAPTQTVDEPMGPNAPVGKLVAQLTAEIRVDLMATAGDFLYVGNFEGLSRCRKSNCIPTLELLRGVGKNLADLQIHGQSLGVVHNDAEGTWLATYSLPAGEGEQVVLAQLPNTGARNPYWHGDFVYWGLDIDYSVYRCRVRGCKQGPMRLGGVYNLRSIQVDGDVVFWNDDSFIYRSANFGEGPLKTLLPDEFLNEALIDERTGRPMSEYFGLHSLATGDGNLYASLGANECYQGCAFQIVRWPSSGGAREVIVSSPKAATAIFVFGAELVWSDSDSPSDLSKESTLWSCLVDACDTTRRKLGYVTSDRPVVVADATDLYWLEAGPNPNYSTGTTSWINGQIRRAPRLVLTRL